MQVSTYPVTNFHTTEHTPDRQKKAQYRLDLAQQNNGKAKILHRINSSQISLVIEIP